MTGWEYFAGCYPELTEINFLISDWLIFDCMHAREVDSEGLVAHSRSAATFVDETKGFRRSFEEIFTSLVPFQNFQSILKEVQMVAFKAINGALQYS